MDWNQLTNNRLITHLTELEEQSKVQCAAQHTGQNSISCSDISGENAFSMNVAVDCDKRKNFMMFQRMQSLSIDCLRNTDDNIGPKLATPLERRLSTGSVVLDNDFILETPIVEANQNTNAVSPRSPPQPVTVDALMKKKLNDVLQEGILDSVLPYLVPKPVGSLNTSIMPMLFSKSSSSSSENRKGSSAQENQANENGEKGRSRTASYTPAVDASKLELVY